MSARREVFVPVSGRNGYLGDQNGCHLQLTVSSCKKSEASGEHTRQAPGILDAEH